MPRDDFAGMSLCSDAKCRVDLVAGLEELLEEFDWRWGVAAAVSRAVDRT